MKPISLIAKQSFLSILGTLSEAVPGGSPGHNSAALANAAPVAAGTTARFDSASFTTKTGRVQLAVSMTLSKNSGTLAAGDVVTFTIVRDSATVIGSQSRFTAATDGSDVIAFSSLAWIDSGLTPGVAHTWGIIATIAGGHTGGILALEASVAVLDI